MTTNKIQRSVQKSHTQQFIKENILLRKVYQLQFDKQITLKNYLPSNNNTFKYCSKNKKNKKIRQNQSQTYQNANFTQNFVKTSLEQDFHLNQKFGKLKNDIKLKNNYQVYRQVLEQKRRKRLKALEQLKKVSTLKKNFKINQISFLLDNLDKSSSIIKQNPNNNHKNLNNYNFNHHNNLNNYQKKQFNEVNIYTSKKQKIKNRLRKQQDMLFSQRKKKCSSQISIGIGKDLCNKVNQTQSRTTKNVSFRLPKNKNYQLRFKRNLRTKSTKLMDIPNQTISSRQLISYRVKSLRTVPVSEYQQNYHQQLQNSNLKSKKPNALKSYITLGIQKTANNIQTNQDEKIKQNKKSKLNLKRTKQLVDKFYSINGWIQTKQDSFDYAFYTQNPPKY